MYRFGKGEYCGRSGVAVIGCQRNIALAVVKDRYPSDISFAALFVLAPSPQLSR
jgi:hypothetical protein